jgi:triphosphoribosyl-dephospho-CoA synthase
MSANCLLNEGANQPKTLEGLIPDRSALFQRHDWVWVSKKGVDLSLVKTSHIENVQEYLSLGPLVVTRRSPADVTASVLRLGLCLPNEASGKPHRIALNCSESDVIAHRPALLLNEIQSIQEELPEPWVKVLKALNQLQQSFSISLRLYGSLAWQAQHHGKAFYIHKSSDLDLLIISPPNASDETQHGLLKELQKISSESESLGGPHIDGEIRHPQMGDLSWQEWLQVSQSKQIRVLSKRPSSVSLILLDTENNCDSRKRFAFHTDQLDEWAIAALRAEAMAWPKPGLVSPIDNGSHKDMNIHLLLTAIDSLRSWFAEFARAAQAGAEFKDLAAIGRAAEAVMMRATRGINVYRGAIFNLGLLVSSAAISSDTKDIPNLVARRWGSAILEHQAPTLNHGVQLRVRLGSGGALQEAARGFPTLTQHVLPAFVLARQAGYSEEHSLIAGLLASIQHLEDTNLIWRGGLDGLKWAQQKALEFHTHGGLNHPDWLHELTQMHAQFIEKNLSPGGSADIAACALFLSRLSEPMRIS